MGEVVSPRSDVPKPLRGRILPILTLAEVQAIIKLERAHAPIPITPDEFEQRFYDAVDRDKLTPRSLIFERMNRRYEVTS